MILDGQDVYVAYIENFESSLEIEGVFSSLLAAQEAYLEVYGRSMAPWGEWEKVSPYIHRTYDVENNPIYEKIIEDIWMQILANNQGPVRVIVKCKIGEVW